MAPALTKSRKKRKTEKWRKNADVQDVEEGLEELRTELIQGYMIINQAVPLKPEIPKICSL